MTPTLIDIDYDETSLAYSAVVVTHGGVVKRFETGDPVMDWSSAINYATECPLPCMYCSSCDRFVMDVKGYRFEDDMLVSDDD